MSEAVIDYLRVQPDTQQRAALMNTPDPDQIFAGFEALFCLFTTQSKMEFCWCRAAVKSRKQTFKQTNGDCHTMPFYPQLRLMKWSFGSKY